VKVLTIVLMVLLVTLAVFALLNWSAISAPTPLSLGLTTLNAPLGLVMLAASGLLTATFVSIVVYQRTTALVEARRFARELHAQRELADSAEASRFVDLKAYLEAELRKLDERTAGARADMDAGLARLEAELVARFSEVENGLSAHMAEVEDKIDRALQARAS
jgi:uncharacterized integral membrane protein